MYIVEKELEFSAAHNLKLSYESKCENLHGHNWKVKIRCEASCLNNDGMVVDFKKIKDLIMNLFDHKYLNVELKKLHSNLYNLNIGDVEDINPTAEIIAYYIRKVIQNFLIKESSIKNYSATCIMVTVEESKNNIAIYDSRR